MFNNLETWIFKCIYWHWHFPGAITLIAKQLTKESMAVNIAESGIKQWSARNISLYFITSSNKFFIYSWLIHLISIIRILTKWKLAYFVILRRNFCNITHSYRYFKYQIVISWKEIESILSDLKHLKNNNYNNFSF